MRLAVSEIAWEPQQAQEALDVLRKYGFAGLEIAPPRVAGPTPYDYPEKAADFAAGMKRVAGLSICSMQSIWYGQAGSLFGPERQALLDYTQKAVMFAEAAGCPNLVFGCPKNRVLPEGKTEDDALDFFGQLGAFAASHGTVIALEPNPPLYGTNFINTTQSALAFARRVNSPGFMVNLDFGTIVENGENVGDLAGHIHELHHVHISEPNLTMLQKREGHKQLARLLRAEGYGGFVSVEMKAQGLANLEEAAAWVAEVFA